MLKNLLKQLITLVLISSSVAYVLPHPNTFSYCAWFLICTSMQILAYNLYYRWISIKVETIKNERIALYENQGFEIECTCPKHTKHFIPFNGVDKVYTCNSCNREFKVFLDIRTTMLTSPVDLSKEDQEFVKAYKKLVEEVKKNGSTGV